MSSQSAAPRRAVNTRAVIVITSIVVGLILIALVLSTGSATPVTGNNTNMLVFTVPVFLAGVLSFLSPCTLPILPAYFAFTFQARKQSILFMTIAFFLGLATTMVILGASATAISSLFFAHRDSLTFWGGLIVIAMGVMSLFGKGFTGMQIEERPAIGIVGSYLYGATFALGWTACVGPILGALLTMLATQGLAIVQGAILSFVYAMGLGLPLILVATFFSRLGTGSAFWRFMRGKGFELNLGFTTLYLHSTSVISGILLIVMGYVLASGQMTAISASAQSSPFAQWIIQAEMALESLFGIR
jgi:cytochrome c-type biogenesis protein